jgi:SAM-dependent methyltransferase
MPNDDRHSVGAEREYVLGTGDEEIARLGVQHRVWRSRALDAWRRAGFTVGQTLIDLGCGPGYASLDLAEIVGPSGQIVAIDASRRFLTALDRARRGRGLDHVVLHEVDFNESDLPAVTAHGAWVRWVFSFLKKPRLVLERLANLLAPAGVVVIHEYLHYATWRLEPRSPELDQFVAAVMDSWRAEGGEPDIAAPLVTWLQELGFRVETTQPIIDVIAPGSFTWQWPKAFVDAGARRLVDVGRLQPSQAKALGVAFAAAETNPHALMVTPAVLEIIARRR